LAELLNDKELRSLIGTVIQDGDPSCLRPNSYVMRLGRTGEFLTTGKPFELDESGPKKGIRVSPGYSVGIVSYETLDFRRETVQKVLPGCDLHAQLSPTTDLAREGITAPSTSVDAGFVGPLNWTINNTSSVDRRYLVGEKIYRLTIWKLKEGERPESLYAGDYQGQKGYVHSQRRGPPVGMREAEWEDGLTKGGPEEILETLIKSGYPWHLLGHQFKQVDERLETVTHEYSRIHDQMSDLQRDISEIKRTQDGIPETVRGIVKEDGKTLVTQAIREVLKEEAKPMKNQVVLSLGTLIVGLVGLGVATANSKGAQVFLDQYGLVVGLGIVVAAAVVALTTRSK